jgi:hypothetical protein
MAKGHCLPFGLFSYIFPNQMFATSVSAASTKKSSQSGGKSSQLKIYIIQRRTRIEHHIMKNHFYKGKSLKMLIAELLEKGRKKLKQK